MAVHPGAALGVRILGAVQPSENPLVYVVASQVALPKILATLPGWRSCSVVSVFLASDQNFDHF